VAQRIDPGDRVSNQWHASAQRPADRALLQRRASTDVLDCRPLGLAVSCPRCARIHAVDADRLGSVVAMPCGGIVRVVDEIVEGDAVSWHRGKRST